MRTQELRKSTIFGMDNDLNYTMVLKDIKVNFGYDMTVEAGYDGAIPATLEDHYGNVVSVLLPETDGGVNEDITIEQSTMELKVWFPDMEAIVKAATAVGAKSIYLGTKNPTMDSFNVYLSASKIPLEEQVSGRWNYFITDEIHEELVGAGDVKIVKMTYTGEVK